jgi:micrococcal nuclease
MQQTYIYDATVARVVDADTLDLDVDLGFGVWTRQRIRLVGPNESYFDAWEMRGPEREKGKAATAFVEILLATYPSVLIKTSQEKGKYGRYLGQVMVEGRDLATVLHEHGHGELRGSGA